MIIDNVNKKKAIEIRKFILIVSAAFFVFAIIINGALDMQYLHYPTTPDVANNRIVKYIVKGVTVYITQSQSNMLLWLRTIQIISSVTIGISLLVNYKWSITK